MHGLPFGRHVGIETKIPGRISKRQIIEIQSVKSILQLFARS